MKIYHTATRKDYYSLMTELEVKGCEWMSGEKPTQMDYFRIHGKYTYFYEECGGISLSDGDYLNKHHKDEPIIEYKSKGDKQMLNPECKHCHKKWHQDSAKYCSWCGNKLVDEPEYKVGDYVTVYFKDRTIISKIDKLWEHKAEAHGLWYDQTKVNVKQDFWFISKVSKCRYATSEEIAEYEAALTFHKHGRKPFELKEGDLIRTPSEKFTLILNPENYTKEDFLFYGWEFRSPAEEVNEWLENK